MDNCSDVPSRCGGFSGVLKVGYGKVNTYPQPTGTRFFLGAIIMGVFLFRELSETLNYFY